MEAFGKSGLAPSLRGACPDFSQDRKSPQSPLPSKLLEKMKNQKKWKTGLAIDSFGDNVVGGKLSSP
jgi:hypothetical protein